MLKFRTMVIDAEASKKGIRAMKNDPRATRVGRWLRKTRLDELSQCIHILRGEMSLTDPRPERPCAIRNLEQEIPFYTEKLYNVKPGITGLAQVYKQYSENNNDIREKLAYDHAYGIILAHPLTWIITECQIIFATIKIMLLAKGQ